MAYLPRIYRFATAVYAARQRESAARAMWRYRIDQRRRLHRPLAERLRREGVLPREWSVDEATEVMIWLFGLHSWEYFVVQFGWDPQRYAAAMSWIARRLLTDDRDR